MLRIITILAFNLEGKASRDRARPQPAGKNSMTEQGPNQQAKIQ